MLESVWIIPFLATLFALLAFFIGHFVALANNQVLAWYAFISDGGARPPASCIFGQLLNISAMFIAATAYIRHLQIVLYYEKINHVPGRWRCVSTVLMYIGYTSALGTSLVANFQVVHRIGAFLAFYSGVIYCWGQVIFVAVMKPHLGGLIINLSRFILALIVTVPFITYHVFSAQRPSAYPNGTVPELPKKDGIVWVEPDSPYYRSHKAGAISEWIMGIGLFVYLLTFAFEFWKTSVHAPKLVLNRGATFKLSFGTTKICPSKRDGTEGLDNRNIEEPYSLTKNTDGTGNENLRFGNVCADGAAGDRKELKATTYHLEVEEDGDGNVANNRP